MNHKHHMNETSDAKLQTAQSRANMSGLFSEVSFSSRVSHSTAGFSRFPECDLLFPLIKHQLKGTNMF